MISNLLAIPYKVARTPLAVIDGALIERLPEGSLPRTTLDRLIGTSDKLAGTMLGDPSLAERGIDRLERCDTLRKAAKLQNDADRYHKEADRTMANAHEEAAQKRTAADEHVAEVLDVADVVEVRGKREARAEAKNAEASKKAAADRKAEKRDAAIDQRRNRIEANAEAVREDAQNEAKAKLDHARQVDQAAEQSRAQAERLDSLAEAKKRERKQR